MKAPSGWFHHHSFFGLLCWVHFKTLPHSNGFICRNCCHGGVIWAHGHIENPVLVALKNQRHFHIKHQFRVKYVAAIVHRTVDFIQTHGILLGSYLSAQ